jgi:hypothetical protein
MRSIAGRGIKVLAAASVAVAIAGVAWAAIPDSNEESMRAMTARLASSG